jgi:quercetin dioxygenase-like cupin family protein
MRTSSGETAWITGGIRVSKATASVSIDNDRVRVTTWTFKSAGTPIGRHRHEFDYIVIPVTGGTFRVIDPDGAERQMEQVAGSPYLGTVGTEHDVISTSEGETAFVEIELKGRTAGR